MPTLTKINFKRRSYPLQYSHRSLKRQFKRFVRLLALNFFLVTGIFLITFIIIFKCLNRVPKTNRLVENTENTDFQPLVGELEIETPIPHYDKNVQFEMPDVKGDRKDWNDYAAIVADRQRQGPGEHGEPVYNTDDSLKDIEEHISLENGFNAFVSDLISVNRSLPELPDRNCYKKRYLAKLPTVSIVIPCRNEYKSVLQRTLHSIVNRTPKKLLKEIIIVDDNSYRGYTVDDMSEYADSHFPNLVKFVRLYERKGLIFARVAGAKIATGDVLIFFDSHIECNHNWLPPLLEPIAINDRISTSPSIDNIQHNSFEYLANAIGHRGVFNWDLTYDALYIPLDASADHTKPYKDPVMMGGLFAISRRFFWELGGYDVGLDIWGAEQFEISFKIWMCGGMLLVTPCSHVGHIFRGPWQPESQEGNPHFLQMNNKRVAEVWMDEYKKYVYDSDPNVYKKLNPGNLTELHALRKRLNCKSFRWYLEFVAPDVLKANPIDAGPFFANGAIQSVAYPQLCLDNLRRQGGAFVGIFYCAPSRVHPHSNQFWNFNMNQEIKVRSKNLCLDVPEVNSEVFLFQCHRLGGNQFWYYDKDSKWLIHVQTNACLELIIDQEETKVVVNECSILNVRMRWIFGYVNNSLTPLRYEQ